MSGVNIYMQKDSIGIGVTDIEGEFRFAHNKMGLSDTIVFSYVGYSSFKCTLSELRHLEYKVFMYELPQLLHEVVVSGERPPFFLEWTSLASLPKPLYSFGGFLHDGKIYVVAGDETLVRMVSNKYRQGTEAWEYRSNNMYVYDIASDVWKNVRKVLCLVRDIPLNFIRIKYLFWVEKDYPPIDSWNIQMLQWRFMI